MALRALVYYGNPILRQKAKKIHRFDASFVARLSCRMSHYSDGE
jgi:peptide deformylase